jgi:hypothetical protein
MLRTYEAHSCCVDGCLQGTVSPFPSISEESIGLSSDVIWWLRRWQTLKKLLGLYLETCRNLRSGCGQCDQLCQNGKLL